MLTFKHVFWKLGFATILWDWHSSIVLSQIKIGITTILLPMYTHSKCLVESNYEISVDEPKSERTPIEFYRHRKLRKKSIMKLAQVQTWEGKAMNPGRVFITSHCDNKP